MTEFGKEKHEPLTGTFCVVTSPYAFVFGGLADWMSFYIHTGLTDEQIEERVRSLVLTPSS